jgi:NAD(P)H-nitrite reductase large subunit
MEKTGVESLIGEVVSIDTKGMSVKLADGETIGYDKLVLATGSLPVCAKWLKGGDKANVITIPKDRIYLDEMKQKLDNCKRVAVIGAGFIGVEFPMNWRRPVMRWS